MPGFTLPDAPAELAAKPVRAWSAPVVIPTYEPHPPDKNPMFLEKRVYQGSSGRVYPLPFIDRISTEKKDRAWQAIHIENEFVRLMILPELGGRIHVGLDKTNGYDFFYRQNVIKPALIGLAGPWISGGVEFNWPQHHRPSTFMPVDTHIEEHADGSVTVWCSEHEPMTRMKGTHGIHLKPGSSLIELKVRLYNRTELPQTFLWWANVAARVHEHYQSFFPPDVQYVADHAKRAMARFPLCEGAYYGIDYAARAKEQEAGSKKQEDGIAFPPGDYPRNDLSWYANIPVPTSYTILGTKEDFFGGYDHHAQAGFVHVADHRISPGKKQWTWGNHPFGYAWDRNLTDPEDPADTAPPYRRHLPAPYIELMAGVFTDNQPDFSHLMPGETRAFSQFWYPIQKIGPAQKANHQAALSMSKTEPEALARDSRTEQRLRIGVTVTSKTPNARLTLHRGTILLFEKPLDLAPGQPFLETLNLPPETPLTELRLALIASTGQEIIAYQPAAPTKEETPEPAQEPALPADIKTTEELYLIGLHLEQYRHATRMPQDYWREALKHDPTDSRCNNALGLYHLRRGEFGKAVACFETAIQTLNKWNPNPRDGEPFYNLGIALRYLNRLDDAYEAFGKAMWSEAWKPAAQYAITQIDCLRQDYFKASLQLDPVVIYPIEALREELLQNLSIWRPAKHDTTMPVIVRSPFDHGSQMLAAGALHCNTQTRFDLALECARGGFFEHAILSLRDAPAEPGCAPLTHYYRAYFLSKLNRLDESKQEFTAAALAPPDYCFPHRLDEIAILLDAIAKNPDDPRAPYYLGNLLYDKGRHEEAITWWEKAAKLDRSFPTVWRNLGIGYYNVIKDKLAAKGAYQKAFTNSLTWGVPMEEDAMVRESPDSPGGNLPGDANREIRVPTGVPRGDARILYERDQLWKRCGELPAARAAELEKYPELVRQRDDLTMAYCTLLNQLQRYDEALAILKGRHFQPREGGEGLVLGQWARTHIGLGRKMLWRAASEGGSPRAALALFETGLNPPENLGEAWHPLQNNGELHYWAGVAAGASGADVHAGKGKGHQEIAAASVGDFPAMAVQAYSQATYWAALAMRELGRHDDARQLLEGMLAHSAALRQMPAKIDCLATSLPAMLLFDEDLEAVKMRQARLLELLARHGLSGGQGRDRKTARRLLNDLLAENPSDAAAADLMAGLDWEMG